VAKEYIRPNTVVLDVGANFGQMGLLFSDYVESGGHVYSFEANRSVFEVLERNIKASHRQNITPVFGAVYDKDGQAMSFPVPDFQRFKAYGSYGIDPSGASGPKVTSLTIDSLNIQAPISFLKVDVQGSDLFALRGAVRTIARHQMPIIFEFEQQFQDEFGTTFNDYVDFVSSISYKFETVVNGINYVIVPKVRRLQATENGAQSLLH
jgi:FkbM family methyltransferase